MVRGLSCCAGDPRPGGGADGAEGHGHGHGGQQLIQGVLAFLLGAAVNREPRHEGILPGEQE
ncbi:hypothetical protein SGL43_06586 [Streptomyces globisporus]|uniref:Uncharacterized protein n=1 Tax=Streptomyces globisporus TaxID=1908 RepID=A0ABN8VC44_STRGL|nr:hypothetical protein SGL43_06586 [Streptomyces globisporus]